MSEGFAPGDRVRDIDPEGDGPVSNTWDDADADDAQATAPLMGGHGRRLVRSTTGGPTLDAATAAANSPSAPDGLEWSDPAGRAEHYETAATPLKGRKARRAHRELIAARRRAEAERAAAEADLESRGVAGFRDGPRHAGLVAMSNPEYAPSRMYEAADPTAPERGKPWFKRLYVVIPAVVLLLAGLVAGIGLPAVAQARATAQADDAAREFLQAMAEYDAAWTPENLDALTAAATSEAIGEPANVLQQSGDAQIRLTEECTVLAGATRAADALSSDPPPSLTVLSSTSFSASYREAQQIDAEFAAERLAGQTLLGAVSATLGPLSAFCTNYQGGIAIENQAALRDGQELAPMRTVPEGGTSSVDGQTIVCTDPDGCVDLGDEAARASYAAAWRAIQEERTTALVAHYRDACWLAVLRPYCTLMSDAWDEARGGVAQVATAMGSERPARDPSQGVFPRWNQAISEQALAFQAVADSAKLEAGAVDAPVLADADTGWEARMLVRLVASYETHLSVAVDDYLDLVTL